MIGIVCEKPSQARNFAKALGGASGTYNGEKFIIVALRGHLYTFDEPHLQVPAALKEKYHSWNLENLPWDEKDFAWKYKVAGSDAKTVKDNKELLKDLKSKLDKCDEIADATDWDPSGEGFLLFAEVAFELKLTPKKWSRLHFVDESAKEIQTAFVNRADVPDLTKNEEYIMSYLRCRWDFLSQQFTRISTKCGDGHSVLREGRLKSAMKVLVGDQLKLVNSYQKIPYYQNRFKDENGVMYTNPEEPNFKTKDEVPNIYHDSDVVVDSKTMKKTAPPKLLDLAALSSRLAPKGFKAKVVADVYQKMYEAEVVSYPRTEDKTITPEQFNDLLPLVDDIAAVVGVDTSLLTHRTARSTHVKKGGAHGANRPGLKVPKSLDALAVYDKGSGCAAAIYEILAKNYLAMLAEDYEYEAQKGHVKDYPKFVGNASVPKFMGWKAVFNDDADVDPDDNAKGLGTHANPFVYEGFPPKPATPTMKWLMAQLEKWDIGTGATRNSTYAEVTNEKTKYPLLKDTKGKISMTQYGEMSYLLLKDTNIGSLEVTKQLFDDMKSASKGQKDPAVILADIQRLVVEDIKTMEKNSPEMRKELKVMAGTSDAEKYEGTWEGNTVKFKKVWGGHEFTDEECEKLCNGEEIEIEAVSKDGKPYKCKGKLENQVFEKDGKKFKYVGFKMSEFVNSSSNGGNGSGVPDSWCGHTFTEDEKTVLESGCIVEADFISKKKSKFHCQVKWAENSEGKKVIIPEFSPDFNR